MNTNKKYTTIAFLLLLTYTTFQNAGIIGDVVSDADNLVTDTVNTADNVADNVVVDTVNTTNNLVDDAVDPNYNNQNNYRNRRYNNGNYFIEDIAYTPGVTADKAVHPIESAQRPLTTAGDIVPFKTYNDYRADYDYRK